MSDDVDHGAAELRRMANAIALAGVEWEALHRRPGAEPNADAETPDDTPLPFPRDRTLGGADNPLRLPEWNDAQLAAIVIRQAVVHDGLVQVLLEKGVITEDELAASIRVSAAERLATIVGELPTFE